MVLRCALQQNWLPMSESGQTRTSALGAARPLPPSADIGPGGQSVGQAAQFCLGRLALQVFRIKPVGEKPESTGLAPHPRNDQTAGSGVIASETDCYASGSASLARGLRHGRSDY